MNDLDLWFKPKPYIHFSTKIKKADLNWLKIYLNNEQIVAKHAFYPLIHKVLFQRKFRRGADRRIKTRVKYDTKSRHIYYSTHLDSHIYALYAKKLNEKYESKLNENDELSSSVIAYRRIPKEFGKGNKSNIEFANEVFKFIKDNNKDCVALTFDIKNFFDDLDHKKLKTALCRLLEERNLPDDYFNIFKSLTNFAYVEEIDLLKQFSIKHRNDLREIKSSSIGSPKVFRDKIIDSNLIKKNSKVNLNGKLIGIPQGTPLSAFLSNLYLLEFDKAVLNFLSKHSFNLYRRYSDDIVVICEPSAKEEIETFIYEKINCFNLIIQSTKTECVYFKKSEEGLTSEKYLNYLGFSFNGNSILIKSASLAKYYRAIKTYIRVASKKAKKRKIGKNQSLFRRHIYRLSHLYSRNFYNYAKRASLLMDDKRKLIKGQVKNHWKIIHRELKKREQVLD